MRYALSGMALLLMAAPTTHADDEYLFADNFGDDYLSAVNAVARQLRTTQSGQIERAGKQIANQLVAGGKVYIHDRTGGLWTESQTRAGGLPGLLHYRPNVKDAKAPVPGKGDLLITFMHTLSTGETNLIRHVLKRGARVIAVFPMSPTDPRTLALLRLNIVAIDSCAGTGRGVLVTRNEPNRYLGSVAAPAAVLALWAMLTEATQQMLANAVRPKVFAGDLTEAGRKANIALAGLDRKQRFTRLEHRLILGGDDESLCSQYLSGVYRVNADMSGRVIFPEKPPYPLEQAVDPSMKAAKAGRVFHWDASPVVRVLLAAKGIGRPAFVKPLDRVEQLAAGDVLWLGDAAGGCKASAKIARTAKSRGATVIGYGGSHRSKTSPSLKPIVQFYLDLGTPPADGIVNMPNTREPLGPVSTLVQVEAFWMLALRTHQKLLPKAKADPGAVKPDAEKRRKPSGPFGF